MDRFVDRDKKLSRLRKCYESEQGELAVIYGRHRLGKTQLVQHSLRDRDDAVIYQGTETTAQLQLNEFVDTAAETFPGITNVKQNWQALLEYLGDQNAVVVLDEFPYLVDSDGSLPSVIQRLWDQYFQKTSGTLVLVGSSIGMMEEVALLGNSPLYGRATEKLDLRPLDFAAAQQFLPDVYTPEDRVVAWGILGGVPYYLDGVDLSQDLETVLTEEMFSQQGYLHNEPEYVLRTELTNPNRYFAILSAIAAGKTTTNEIAQSIGIDGKQISTYAQKLERLRLIEREVPLTEQKAKSRRGRYRFLDPLFRFWFRFVYGNEDRYERLGEDAYQALIKPELADFVSPAFKRLCQEALPELYPDETFLNIGRWWDKEHEVDVVGFTDGQTMVVGECEFTNAPLEYNALTSLESQAEEIRWTPQNGCDVDVEYAMFTRNGATQAVRDAVSERDDLRLFGIGEVVQLK